MARHFEGTVFLKKKWAFSKNKNGTHCLFPGGGGVTTIYEGTGCAIFEGAFFPAENKFWGIIFGKMTCSHKFWGVILEK